MRKKLILIYLIQFISLVNVFSEVTFYSIQDFAFYMTKRNEELNVAKKIASLDLLNHKLLLRDFFPKLDFTYNASSNLISDDKELAINFRQKIFDGGKQRLNYKLNSVIRKMAVKELKIEEYNFYKTIVQSFFDIVLLEKKIEIQEKLCKTLSANLKKLESKEVLGLGIALDSYNGKIDCLEAEQTLNEFRSKYELTRLLFEKKLGIVLKDFVIKEKDLLSKNYIKKELGRNVFFNLVKENDLGRKKELLLLDIEKEIAQWNKRTLIPNIDFCSTVSFSGKNFPLTEPKIYMGLEINFENNFFPGDIVVTADGEKNQIPKLNTSLNFNFLRSVSFFIEEINTYYEFTQRELDLKTYEDNLEVSFLDLIHNFNNLVTRLEILKEKTEISKQKCEIENRLFLQGKLTASEYDRSLFDLANYEIELFSVLYELELQEIEIQYFMQGKEKLYE